MNAFETLREQVPIGRLVGPAKGGKARCVAPGHPDDTPSMHVYDDHVHCFACGFHGDVTDVWAAMRGLGGPIEAAVDLAREFGVALPEFSEEARQKHEERRQAEQDHLKVARACHADLEKRPKVAGWWEGRGFSAELQERYLLGTTEDGGAATIPLWSRGRVQGIVRRKLEGEPKYILPKAEELPDGHKPLFIPGPLTGGEVFLVEGYIDALAVAAAGKSVIAVGGTDLSEAQQDELAKVAGTIYILPDIDKAGAEAVREWARDLYPRARICPASYGAADNEDAADLFAHAGPEKTAEHLSRLAEGARDLLDLELDEASELDLEVRERLTHATERIVPLLVPIHPAGLQDATTDIVAEKLKLKKSWLNKAIKDENERQFGEQMAACQREREEEFRRRVEEYRQQVAEAQPEIDTLLEPGVLGRLRDMAAAMHSVRGDREPLELALLVALGAQLEPLPNGRPLGASILLTAEAGRGKNHIVDAAVKPLPPEFYFAFEIASGQSLYYKADEDPGFLKHTFAYPNEIEGAEALWEFLRPMLSKGEALKIVTAKDADGNMTTRTILVEGPVTLAIPTIRNKTDEQLQTRLLIAELPDYPGRVKEHSAAISEQLLPDAAVTDYSREQFLWREALRQLTERRRVVLPLKHPDFALDDDNLSHGARLWANLLSLMATNAWLEQRNRRLIELSSGEVAIEATPSDYETAYRIFTKVCKRTVVNLSDVHRAILDSLYELQQDDPSSDGFSQRRIAEEAKVSQGTISNNRTYLVTSAKLIRETEHGLILVSGAEPSWWAEDGDMMKGLPTPTQVRTWWKNPPEPPKSPNRANQPSQTAENPHTYAGSGDQVGTNHATNRRLIAPDHALEESDHDQQLISEGLIARNGSPMRDAGLEEPGDHVISPIKGAHEDGAADSALIRRVEYALDQEHMGAAKYLPLYLRGETTLEVLTNSVLYVLHEEQTPMSTEERREWERAVELVAGRGEEGIG